MKKDWLYMAGIMMVAVVLIFLAITAVKRTHPAASDLRAAYQQTR